MEILCLYKIGGRCFHSMQYNRNTQVIRKVKCAMTVLGNAVCLIKKEKLFGFFFFITFFFVFIHICIAYIIARTDHFLYRQDIECCGQQ